MTGDAMQPTRDPRATLPDLIEVLLNKGVHLNLDLIISVADIPLIGVNLRATIAGIETMLEYGMMRQWDSDTREWVQRAVRTHLPIADDEEILAKMAGGHYQDNFYRTWRPGSAYLTSKRLIIHRRDPAETLWQARLNSIASVSALRESSIGGEERTRILVRLQDDSEAILSALEPDRLISLVQAQLDRADDTASSTPEAKTRADRPLREGRMWFLETMASGSTWRGGQAALSNTELTWRSPMDGRARVRISPEQLQDMRREEHSNPTDEPRVLILDTADSTITLAADDAAAWSTALEDWQTAALEDRQSPALEATTPPGRNHDERAEEGAASWR
ncbi:gas vesicle protein [Brevibacterium renqingii]|uniref:gas vesicle protein n=1 Tax=Brevibacterium renqingii TaxID=2776916 RepID=UPI001ADF3352|nr:gas vesicle protein [Brevibacterium renqingii]